MEGCIQFTSNSVPISILISESYVFPSPSSNSNNFHYQRKSKLFRQKATKNIIPFFFPSIRKATQFFGHLLQVIYGFAIMRVYKASCWEDGNDFFIGKTKRRFRDRETDHYRALTDRIKTRHNIKWDHFEVLANGRSDLHCKIKETLPIRKRKPTLNKSVGSEKVWRY